MDVVRHDAPLQEPIALSVELEQSVAHEGSDLGSPQMAFAPACILVAGYPAVEFVVAGLVGAPLFTEPDFLPPSFDHFSRHTVREAERDPLGGTRRVGVWEIAAGYAGFTSPQ